MIGQTLSYFKITAKLGEGGMGQVYRASDTRLNRDVAIKVLPAELTQFPERLARFEREAQLLASLSHPNIGAIHGLEEAEGERFLVLELIEGEDLAERLSRGPVPLEEAARYALQIAEALEAAHDKGIIHRDLKPANIKLTPEGQVKVLDFGLAKALEDEPGSQDIHNSPTLTAAATQAGIILGTAAYMAPEQAAGEAADRRADIWSFGVVLSEMLTGHQRFRGQTVSHVLAAVLKDDPNWTDFPSDVPKPIFDLLERCLRKDRNTRLQAIGDARIALQEYFDDPEAASVALATEGGAHTTRPAVVPWSVAALMAIGLALVLWQPWVEPPPLLEPVRLTAAIGADATLGTSRGAAVVISPDGQRLAFVGQIDGTEHLFVRPLDHSTATRLAGTEGARKPFFSPDGEWIGFFDSDLLKKVAFRGGAVVTLADAQSGRGGAWSDDGRIAFTVDNRSPLVWIPEAGGQPQNLTALDKERGDISQRYPQFLPGGLLLYTAHGGATEFEDGKVVIEDLEQGKSAVVVDGAMYGRYLASGHLVYVHDETLFVAPIDLDRLEITAAPVPAIDGVSSNPVRGTAQYDVSRTGTMVHQSGSAEANLSTVRIHSADGTIASLIDEPGVYYDIHLSPDGGRLALEAAHGGNPEDIWVYELERGVMTRLTFDDSRDENPVWTPDGSRIAFDSDRHGGPPNIYWKPADGTGATERLTVSENSQYAYSWSPDGRTLAYVERHPATTADIWTVTLEGDAETGWVAGEPQPFLTESTGEFHPAFSPDGRWIAYMSLESGETQIYVRPFPGADGKWQISIEGGVHPIWSPDGRTLYYRQGSRIMSVDYEASAEAFRAARPTLWGEANFSIATLGRVFSRHPDGRMAVVTPNEDESPEDRRTVNFIFNFFTELEHIAPARPGT